MIHRRSNLGASMFAIHLVAFLFGMTGILGSLIDGDPNTITFGRAAFAVLALTPLLLSTLGRTSSVTDTPPDLSQDSATQGRETRQIWAFTSLSGLLLAVHWVTFFMSVKIAGVALATLGFSSFAAFITAIEWCIDRHHIRRADWLRTLGVSVGLILMTPSLNLDDQNTIGFIFGLASGLSFAAMAVVNSRKLAQQNPIRIARNQNLIVAVLLLPLALPHLSALTLSSWLWLAILGILCTGLSHSLFVYSLKRLRVSIAGLVVALEPVYAIAVAWLLFAQTPEIRTLIGGAIIVGSILGVRAATAAKPPSAAEK